MLTTLKDRMNSRYTRPVRRFRSSVNAGLSRSSSPSCLFETLEPRVLLSVSVYARVDDALEASTRDYAGGLIAVDLNGGDLLDLVTANVGSLPGEKNLLNLQFGS